LSGIVVTADKINIIQTHSDKLRGTQRVIYLDII